MKLTIALLALAFFAQGCSSMVHGTKQELQINTIPQGAVATIGMQTCRTPCRMEVPRSANTLKIERGAYRKTFDMEKDFQFGTTICGNICWILPGAIIDIASGAAWEIRTINLRLDASE
jgi:hypothetical protein